MSSLKKHLITIELEVYYDPADGYDAENVKRQAELSNYFNRADGDRVLRIRIEEEKTIPARVVRNLVTEYKAEGGET